MPVYQVKVSGATYPNVVERGALSRLAAYIPQDANRIFVVTTQDVWELHGAAVEAQFDPDRLRPLLFAGGESNKRMAAVEALAEELSLQGADRRTVVAGFGGGIVTDIAGFLAAIFMRGLRVIQIPTTLLAQVDAGIGGKTGVNLNSGKNLVGSFHQPLAVLIDPDVLATLPEREYRAGLFEIIKCGVIRDPELFERFERQRDAVLRRDPSVVDELVSAAVRIKAEVVTADEKESDLRRILNFGHTVGHAIESETQYLRFLHGEAVGCGMVAAATIARLSGLLPETEERRIYKVIESFGPFPPTNDLEPDRLLAAMSRDKKTVNGTLHFVLPTRVGDVRVVNDVDEGTVREAISQTLL